MNYQDPREPATERTAQERLAFRILVAHVFLVCSFGRYYSKIEVPGPGIQLYSTDLVLLLLFVLGFRQIRAVPWDRITKLVALFVAIGVAWLAISGLDSEGVGLKAFSFFVYAGFYFATRGLATTESDRWRLLDAILYASIVGALLGLWQMQTGAMVFDTEQVTFEVTTTGSTRWLPGEFALYGVAALMIAAMRPLMGQIPWRRVLPLLVSPGLVLILAQHRSGLVALAAVLLAMAIFLVGSRRILNGLLALVALGCMAIVFSLYFLESSYVGETFTRVQHLTDTSDPNVAWRLLAYLEVLDGVLEQPLGHGFSSWSFFFTLENPLTGSHNSYLDLAYRVGVPGLLVFIAIPAALTFQSRKVIRRTGAGANAPLVAACAVIYAVLAYAFFNVVFVTPYMSVLFYVMLGLASAAYPRSTDVAGPAKQ